jgi:hypothetical protein
MSRVDDSKSRAAAAKLSVQDAQASERRAAAKVEFEAACTFKGDDNKEHVRRFTRVFWAHQEAVMADRLNTHGMRFMAWLKRYSWGESALFAIGKDGWPRLQDDAARELGIDKRIVSNLVKYYEQRGYMTRDGRKLIPTIAPELGPIPEGEASSQYQEFLEGWNAANATEFEAYEKADATKKRINKLRLSAYKKALADAKQQSPTPATDSKAPPAAGEPATEPATESPTPFELSNRQHEILQAPAAKASSTAELDAALIAESALAKMLYAEIGRLQGTYPESDFARERIDPAKPAHQNLVRTILKIIGPDQEAVVGYVVWVGAEFKGVGHAERARSRAPGSPGGPQGLGFLVRMAEDYARIDRPAKRRRGPSPADRLSEALEIDTEAAGKIWAQCKAAEASITADEVIAVAQGVLDTRKVRSSITGTLLTYVPKAATGGPLKAARERLVKAKVRPDADGELAHRLGWLAAGDAVSEADLAKARKILADPKADEQAIEWAKVTLELGAKAAGE